MGAGSQKPHEAFVIQPAPPVGPGLAYASARAFHEAVKARLITTAKDSPYSVAELRRQFAYDRLLTRVFFHDPDHWVLKGATGLLSRLPDQARHSMDVDLYFQGELDAAVASLIAATDLDLGDYFTFDIEKSNDLAGGNPGARIKVASYIGDTMFMGFRIDAVIATNMTGAPESTAGLSPITIAGLPTAAYRTYPVVDHIADKHAAMVATYQGGSPSSRYRDLVDLVLLATTQRPEAGALHTALTSEYHHRGVAPPAEVTLPSPNWTDGYAHQARDVPKFAHRTAESGLAVVKAMLDPILTGRTTGRWDPEKLAWVEH
ncbi:MAG: nucleotidyl transferase AbiEii/AbiGii toxin family protein [Acidimicrobiia bacterium]|nr:nucleotidyl transferase AbiEii/AbiGii toxin family protein [Acidimicrobiia bacterium]